VSQLSVVLQTHDFLTQRELAGVRFKVDSLRWAARGGCESATITAEGDLAALEELIDFCSDPIEVRDENGNKPWYGYIHEATVQNGSHEYGATLEGMANYVAVAYDNGSGRATTSWVQDGASINRRGTFERLFTTSSRTAAQCEQLRDTKLDMLAHPLPIVRDVPGGEGVKATLQCKGWYGTLNRRYYTSTGLKQEYFVAGPSGVDGIKLDDFYIRQWGDAYQRILFTGSAPWALDSVAFIFNMEGSCPPLTVNLYAADGAMQSGNINPGTLLGTGTLTGMQPWNQFVRVPIRTAGGARVVFVPSTNYWFKLLTPLTTQTWSVACGPLQGTNNAWQENAAEGYNESKSRTMWYRLTGFLDNAQQVEDAVLATAECITGVDQLDVAGIETDPGRDGDQRLGDLVEDLLDTGSVNNLRMLCTVTEDRRLQIFEEPLADVDTVAYLKRADGQLEDRLGQVISPATNVAGQWCLRKESVPPLSSAPPTESALIFVEACEYSSSDDTLSIEPRTIQDMFSFFDVEEG
jgi:hypothetical protein